MNASLKFGVFLVAATFGLTAHAGEIAVLRNGFEIRADRHLEMGSTTRLFTKGGGYIDVTATEIESFRADDTPALASPAPELQKSTAKPDVKQLVDDASDKHDIDPDLLASVIHHESGFNPQALSSKGAQGLMQLMPGTAEQLGVKDAFDPEANVDAGTRYLRELLARYNGDLIKALAAYNAGPERVQRYKGVPPYHETQTYVANIIREFNRKKKAQATAARDSKQRKPSTSSQRAKAEPPPSTAGASR